MPQTNSDESLSVCIALGSRYIKRLSYCYFRFVISCAIIGEYPKIWDYAAT